MKSSYILIAAMLLVVAAAGWWAFSTSSEEDQLPDLDSSGASGTQPAGAFVDATTTNFSSENGANGISLTYTADQALLTGLGYADVLLTSTPTDTGARYESSNPSLTIWIEDGIVTVSQNDDVIFTGTSETAANSIPSVLTDSNWVWTETIMSNGNTITPDQPDAFTLTFSTDGQLNGTTDCNTFRGQYKVVDSTFDVGPLASTEMACPDAQEQEFIDMIDQANTIYFDENEHLVLLLPVDSGSVIFRPANE